MPTASTEHARQRGNTALAVILPVLLLAGTVGGILHVRHLQPEAPAAGPEDDGPSEEDASTDADTGPTDTVPLSAREAARAQMRNLSQAVLLYKLDHGGKLPRTLAELTESDERSGEPYVETLPDDPWGAAYEIVPARRGLYHIQSAGEDGALDTDDDLHEPPREKDE